MITHVDPVAIGGLGGSGTRVFAALLQHLDVAIGDRLNRSLDNLWFTVLFKRKIWCSEKPSRDDIDLSIDLFVRATTTGLENRLTENEYQLIQKLKTALPPFGDWHCGADAPDVQTLIASREQSNQGSPWGWKEPNTHIFLTHLNRQIPKLKYIHIVRNGLDMAFSKNTWQMRHWGHLFNLRYDASHSVHHQQLRYWTASNRTAIDYGTKIMADRFLLVCYESFCADPVAHTQRIANFLCLPVKTLPGKMVQPTTIGRSAAHDTSGFPPNDLEEARRIQFRVNELGSI